LPTHSYRELAHWRHPATAWVLRLAALGASRGCLGESACRGASTAPSPAACSNELLEIPYGWDAYTIEVDDAVLLHLDSEYGLLWMSFCIVVLIVHILSEQHEHGERRVLDRPRSGEHLGSHLRSAARAIDYLHRAVDVISEEDATSALCEFSRFRRGGQLYNSHEAFVNEGAMHAELRRARPPWGADKHERLRWRKWDRRYRNAPFQLN